MKRPDGRPSRREIQSWMVASGEEGGVGKTIEKILVMSPSDIQYAKYEKGRSGLMIFIDSQDFPPTTIQLNPSEKIIFVLFPTRSSSGKNNFNFDLHSGRTLISIVTWEAIGTE